MRFPKKNWRKRRVARIVRSPGAARRALSTTGSRKMRSLLKGSTALVLSLSMAGAAAAQITEIGPGEGQVNIVAWPGYIERGETDAAFDWVTKFEEATGCKVNVKTANTSDEMVALMNVVDGRRPAEGRALAHGGRRALRHALHVGAERADVQHRGLPRAADLVERGLRGDDPARRQVEQGPGPGL
jgi:hypothetical protein